MRTRSGTVLVLPARTDRPARLVPQAADRAAGQVVYLPRPRRDEAARWPAPVRRVLVRRVLGITGGWLQAVREQSAHSEHPGQSADRFAVHAARRAPRIAARPADREVVPAASRPMHQTGTRKLVLLSQEI